MTLLTKLERFSNKKIIPGKQEIIGYQVEVIDLDNSIGISIENTKDKFDLVRELRNFGFKTIINGNFDIEIEEAKINELRELNIKKEIKMSKARRILETIKSAKNSKKERIKVFEEAVSPKEKQEFVDNFNTSEGRKSIEKALLQLFGHKLSVTIKFGKDGMEVESSDISGEARPKLFKSLKIVSAGGGDYISADEISVPLEYQYELLDGKKVNTKLTTLFLGVSGLVNNAINQLR